MGGTGWGVCWGGEEEGDGSFFASCYGGWVTRRLEQRGSRRVVVMVMNWYLSLSLSPSMQLQNRHQALVQPPTVSTKKYTFNPRTKTWV